MSCSFIYTNSSGTGYSNDATYTNGTTTDAAGITLLLTTSSSAHSVDIRDFTSVTASDSTQYYGSTYEWVIPDRRTPLQRFVEEVWSEDD